MKNTTATQFQTKSEAIAAANELRAEGRTVKVMLNRGTYTQPGVGITSFRYYTISES